MTDNLPASAVRTPVRIDVISDVTCPWCAIGLHALEQAIERVGDAVAVDVRLHAFELNPGLPPEGEALVDYAARKRGATPAEVAQRQVAIRRHGAAAGLALAERTRVYNTRDAHRLLHWAGLQGRQRPLKRALLEAYHVRGENPASHDVLLRAAANVGLHLVRASEVLASGAYDDEVRASTRHWREQGVAAVPTIVLDGQHVIEGGRSVDAYERALRWFAEGR